MNQVSDISSCDIEVDFARLFWEHDCDPIQLRHLAETAKKDLGLNTVAELTSNLLTKLADTLAAIRTADAQPGSIVCKLKLVFDQLVSPYTVQAYLLPLEEALNRVLGSTFKGFSPVKMRYTYTRGLDATQSTIPLLSGGVRKPFEA